MRDLAERVNPRIGATGRADANALAGKCSNGFAENALHGHAVVLRLPADERRAVIFDGELVAGHRTRSQCNVLPRAIGKPRRNSSARVGFRPSRCSSISRTAPSPHATVSSSSSTRPGSPAPLPFVERRTLMRLPAGCSNHAPGNGASPRQWSWTLVEDCVQSIRVSALSILLA